MPPNLHVAEAKPQLMLQKLAVQNQNLYQATAVVRNSDVCNTWPCWALTEPAKMEELHFPPFGITSHNGKSVGKTESLT